MRISVTRTNRGQRIFSQPVLAQQAFFPADCFRIPQTRSWFHCRAEAQFLESGPYRKHKTETKTGNCLYERMIHVEST